MPNSNSLNISLQPGGLEPGILKAVEQLADQSQLPALLQNYIDRSGIDPERFTYGVRSAMVDHLLDRGVRLETLGAAQEVKDGEYDELFALAYEHAVSAESGGSDPIDAARRPGGGASSTPWDSLVDTFEDVEKQGVLRDNILAAGVVDYVYELGEHMGVFKLVDALILNWASGAVDVVDGSANDRLYRYWKRRDERATPEERGMLYRRVLNKGGVDVLSRMVVNEPFPGLWLNLMNQVADYIDKSETVREGRTETSPVSRARIFQATRELQYNLTEYCTGMAHIQARELYAQLQESVDILRDPDILAFFGGNRRKSIWTVIEQLSKRELGASPNIGAIRSLAVDGQAIFRWVADFSEGAVRQDEFDKFLQVTEAYILNFSTVGAMEPEMESDEDAEEDVDSEESEDEDF